MPKKSEPIIYPKIPPDTRELRMVRVGDLVVDENTQRNIDAPKVERIRREFSWDKFEVITASPTPTGQLAVSEGQHRVVALQGIDPDLRVPVIITNSMNYSDRANLAYDISTGRAALRGYDMFKLKLNGNDPYVHAIADAAQNQGLNIGRTGGRRTVKVSMTLLNLAKHNNATPQEAEVLMTRVFKIITSAWPPNVDTEGDRWHTSLLSAIVLLVRCDARMQDEHIIKVLRSREPNLWISLREAPKEMRGGHTQVHHLATQVLAKINHRKHNKFVL